MHIELHSNVVHHGAEFLLLASMLFMLPIPKPLLILKEFLYTIYYICVSRFDKRVHLSLYLSILG